MEKEVLLFTAMDADTGIKIRDYLKNRLYFSTSLIAKVKFGGVLLNGERVSMRAIVHTGDKIEITLPSEESENVEPVECNLEVIYEDKHILAINKPKNMPTHPSRGNHLVTVANAVRAYIGKPFVFRAITRLDRDTSGIVLIAKNQLSAAILSRSLKAGEFEKIYYAKISGAPEECEGEIIAPIAREREGSIKRVVRADGKEAVTKYRTVSIDERGDATLELVAVTGRTHQLRVHMAHIGHPLKYDFLYGERVEGVTYLLHCGRLVFPHPLTKEPLELISEPTFLPQN